MTFKNAANSASNFAALTPAAHISKISTRPVRVKIHGTAYSIWNNPETTAVHYIDDQCAHRGASLSIGTVCTDRIRCKYHGTLYQGQNAVVVDDIVYIETGISGELFPVAKWETQARSMRIHTYERSLRGCNPVTMLENTIDHLHLHTVHKFSLIDEFPTVSIVDDRTAEYRYQTRDGSELAVLNRFTAPWHTSLHFSMAGEFKFSLHTHFVPVSRTETTCIIQVFRKNDVFGRFGDICMELINEIPILEDREIVSSVSKSRKWSDDELTSSDALVAMYRDEMKKNHPDIVELYAS